MKQSIADPNKTLKALHKSTQG